MIAAEPRAPAPNRPAAAPGEPASADLAAHLRLSITRMARRLRQESGSGLTPSLAAALATIERHGPLGPSALAAAERIQRPTATRIVARLQEDGLVAREADPSDGRACLVRITPEGRALLRGLRTRKTAFLARRLESLNARERADLERAAGLLERLLEEDAA